MKIVHEYDILGGKKGILQDSALTDEILKAKGRYKLALELMQIYE